MANGFGQGERFAWPWDLLARLPEEVDSGAVFPLRALDANILHRHLVTPDVMVCGLHQNDGDHNLDVSARPRVGDWISF